MSRQRTDQDRHAGQLQRAAVLPAASGRVHGVLAPPRQGVAGRRRRPSHGGAAFLPSFTGFSFFIYHMFSSWTRFDWI